MVTFGGFNESSAAFLNDTWKFSGGHWTELFPPTAPSPRWLFGMDYDSGVGEVVLFGGGDFGALGDTWTFSGGNWTALSPATSPPARSDLGMAYDAADGVSVLVGGSNGGGPLGDTWTFASGRWTPQHATTTLPNVTDFGIAYDPGIPAVVVATGGLGAASTAAATWTYLHGQWQNATGRLGSSYPARSHQTLAWDAGDGYPIQFGGVAASGFVSDPRALDVLNVSAGPLNVTGENPFDVNVTADQSSGLAPLNFAWSLTNGATLDHANGSLRLASTGSFDLTLRVNDGAGTVLSLGPVAIVSEAPVTLVATGDPRTGVTPLSVSFSASAALGEPPYLFDWTFGDQHNGAGANLTHVFARAGSYSVVATVEDAYLHRASTIITVIVSTAPPPPSNRSNGSATHGPSTILGLAYWELGIIVVVVAAAVVGAIVVLRSRSRGGPQRPG